MSAISSACTATGILMTLALLNTSSPRTGASSPVVRCLTQMPARAGIFGSSASTSACSEVGRSTGGVVAGVAAVLRRGLRAARGRQRGGGEDQGESHECLLYCAVTSAWTSSAAVSAIAPPRSSGPMIAGRFR